jgi:hypothetical protein
MATYPITTKYGRRFLGNKHPSKMEVHDLQNEKTQCQIAEILASGHAVGFTPDSLDEAHRCGFDNCAYCIGKSTR